MSPDTLEQQILEALRKYESRVHVCKYGVLEYIDPERLAPDIARALEAGYSAVGEVIPHHVRAVFEPAFITALSEGQQNDS